MFSPRLADPGEDQAVEAPGELGGIGRGVAFEKARLIQQQPRQVLEVGLIARPGAGLQGRAMTSVCSKR